MSASTTRRATVTAGILLLALLLGRLGLGTREADGPPAAPPAAPPSPLTEAGGERTRDEDGARALDDDAAPPAPPHGPDAEEDGIPFYGFCPEEGTAPETAMRPQLFELARLHSEEMLDRFLAMRRARRGSPVLRDALRDLLTRDDSEPALAAIERAPDRFEEGFDYARAAAILLGMRALSERPRDALRHGRYAEQPPRAAHEAQEHDAFTHDAAAHALVALAARQLGDAAAEREALRAARAIEPDEPAFGLALGRNLAHTPHLDEAIEALDVHLRQSPDDVATAQLRARLSTAQQIQHAHTLHRRGDVTLLLAPHALDDADIDADGLTDLLQSSLEEAATLLGMSPRRELLAVVYSERSELLATTCVPSWTAGVFDGTLRLYAGSLRTPESRRRVVRHEVLHAQLRSERFAAPHWFHEGVAQHFAQETRPAHLRSYAMMVDNRTFIPFTSLEGSFLVIDRTRDAGLAYHQSLAMVELMIDRAGARAIGDAVAYLRSGGDPQELLAHVTAPRPAEGRDLLQYLDRKLRAAGVNGIRAR